jgi:hypothetical protein
MTGADRRLRSRSRCAYFRMYNAGKSSLPCLLRRHLHRWALVLARVGNYPGLWGHGRLPPFLQFAPECQLVIRRRHLRQGNAQHLKRM